MSRQVLFITVGLIVAVTLNGCATTKNWAATGGSRADGTVRLSYEYNQFESPQLSQQQANQIATAKCGVWGYSGAEAFGGVIRECNGRSGNGNCVNWLVTAEYQCLGKPKN